MMYYNREENVDLRLTIQSQRSWKCHWECTFERRQLEKGANGDALMSLNVPNHGFVLKGESFMGTKGCCSLEIDEKILDGQSSNRPPKLSLIALLVLGLSEPPSK